MINITLRPGEYSLSVGIDRKDVLTYDLSGRPVTLFLDGTTYKRGLDNGILMIRRERLHGKGIKERRFLSSSEAGAFLDDVHDRMVSVSERFQSGNARIVRSSGGEEPQPDRVGRWLDQIVALEPTMLAKERDRFHSVYKPIGILPPDQYLSVVLQGTEGCSHNRCTFCGFYRDIDFRIKSPDEFARHIDSVKEFLGPSIGLRKAIFFADANAMIIPQDKLRPMMESMNEEFLIAKGINSFIDAFSGPMKPLEDFKELKELSLRRLYLGLESGNDELLRFLEKPGRAEEALELVRRVKKAGIGIGVIVMAGLGGSRYSEDHINDTVDLAGSMELGGGDILYISDFVAHPGSEYVERCEADGIEAMDAGEILAQRGAIQEALSGQARERGYKIAPYNIQNFVY